MGFGVDLSVKNENKSSVSLALFIGLILMFSVAYNSDFRNVSWLWYGLSAGIICVLFLEIKKKDIFKIGLNDFYSIWAVLVIAFFVVGLLWSANKGYAFDGLKTIVLMFAVNLLLAQKLKNKADINAILIANFIALIALMVYVLFKADFARWNVGFIKIGSVRLGNETLGENWNSNDLGIKLCMGFSLSLHFLLSPIKLNLKKVYKVLIRVALTVITFVFLVLALLSGSKKVILMIVAIACLLAFLRAKKYKLLILLTLIIFVVGLVFAVMKIQPLYETIGIRFYRMFEELQDSSIRNDGSSVTRIRMIKFGFELFKQRPLFGYGLNSFRVFYGAEYGFDTYSHNNFIEILVSGGIVGFMLYYSIYIYVIVKLFKPAAIEREPIAILLFVVNLVFLISGFAFVSYTMTIVNLFLFLGAVYARLYSNPSKFSKKIKKAIANPTLAIKYAKIRYLNSHFGKKLDDKTYLEKRYKLEMGKNLDLGNPVTYNEKLQWLKLYDRKPIYTKMVDKFEAKSYVSSIIGEEHIIPTYGVWDKFEDIDFDKLPNKFVLKCTHDCGGIIICKDKSKLDIKKAKKKINKCLKKNYYVKYREWPYKDVKPRIIAEKYMVDESGYELKDYKFFCFDGEVKYLFIAKDRANPNEETKFDFFDENFNHLPITNGHPNSKPPYFKPDGFEKMRELASKLSKDIPHLRVDFYNINGQIYFGELTFFHWSGFVPFNPPEWDKEFGSLIKLPE